MITLEIEEQADSNWNKRLQESKLGSLRQSKEMGQFALQQGKRPLFLKFIDSSGEIIGQLLIKVQPRFQNKSTKGKFLSKLYGIKQDIYQWNYGPILFDTNKSNEIFSQLDNFLYQKKCKVQGSTNPLQPFDIMTYMPNSNLEKWCTIILDLKKSKEELFDGIEKHSGRKNIERSSKRGVKIEEIKNEDSLIEYCNAWNRTKRDQGFEEKNIENIIDSWKVYKPLGISGFLAKRNGKTVGGISFSYFCGHIIETGIARTEEDRIEKLYSQDLLKWKIIEWGVENQMNYFNLAGFNPNPKDSKEEGIKKYKEKWGGKKQFYWNIRK